MFIHIVLIILVFTYTENNDIANWQKFYVKFGLFGISDMVSEG